MKRTLLTLGVAAAVLIGCNEQNPLPPVPLATATPTVTSTERPSEAPSSTPIAVTTPFVLQSAEPLGPIDPRDPSLVQTPTPRAAQSLERSEPWPKWTGPPLILKAIRGAQSVTTGEDTGGQAGVHIDAYSDQYAQLGMYALLTVNAGDLVLPAPTDGRATYLFGPTMKMPNGCVEFSLQHASQGVSDQLERLNFYDFCAGGYAQQSYDLTDPAFRSKYVRLFPNGHGAQIEMLLTKTGAYATNFLTSKRDGLYISPGGTPSRQDGWGLIIESHFPPAYTCPKIPDTYVDALQVFQQYEDPPSWQVPQAPGGAVTGTKITYGDCFTASSPGAYYEINLPSLPDFGSMKATSINVAP